MGRKSKITGLSYEDERGEAYVNGKRAWIFFGQQRYGLAYGASMKGAIGGNSKALAMLGLIFTGGYGKPKDPVLAVKLFKCAAAQGDMVALRLLANTLSEGEGIEKDETRALKLFERAARQGDIYAEYNVGTMYLKGIGVGPDQEKGLFWLYKAANHGYEPAINLTWQYHKSVGDMEQYVNIIRYGAQKGIKECIDELKSNGGQR